MQSATRMTDVSLAGIGVLVTRPVHQADDLVAAVETHGATAIRFPSIQIKAREPAAIARDASALASPDISIFVSSNAVQHGLQYAGEARIAAVGPATAAAIEAAGRSVDIRASEGFDSEQLLAAMRAIEVRGKNVRILRGQDGRELLADSLRARGANVDYLAVYERLLPDYPQDELAALQRQWRAGGVNVVTAMSVESYTNLLALLGDSGRELLGRTPLVTPATRVLKKALNLFPDLPALLSDNSSADAIVAAIGALRQAAPGQIK